MVHNDFKLLVNSLKVVVFDFLLEKKNHHTKYNVENDWKYFPNFFLNCILLLNWFIFWCDYWYLFKTSVSKMTKCTTSVML